MERKIAVILLAVVLAAGFALIGCDIDKISSEGGTDGIARATTISNKNEIGTHDGYDYELWRDTGNVSMTLNNGGNFSAQWSNIGNVLARKGKKFDSTKTHSQIGNISIKYSATFTPGGNSYLCVYGWSKDPLVEYYIVENYGTYKPTGTSKGTATIDGATYDLYETTRTQQPSIEGTKTFKQYWSVRQSKRSSGTISVSEHFKAWENKGMTLGKLYEVALTAEGYQSSGSANITEHVLTIGGSSSSSNNSSSNNNTASNNNSGSTTTSSGATRVTAQSMTKSGQYTGNISSPFSGVALYANNDAVSFNQNFANNSHTFKLRGASDKSDKAKVQLKIGGTNYGTFEFAGTAAAEKTLTVTHNKGGQNNVKVELVRIEDTGVTNAFVEWIEISSSGSSSTTNNNTTNNNTNTNTNTNTNNNAGTNTGSTTTSSGATRVTAQSMTKSGQYTGNISSPFAGVALYANNDAVSFNQNFANNSHTFKLRGASDKSDKAKVQLKIGGTNYGTFEFAGTAAAEKTLTVTHNQSGKTAKVELIRIEDTGVTNAFVEWIEISASGSTNTTTNNNTGSTNTGSTTTSEKKYTFSDLKYNTSYGLSYAVNSGALKVDFQGQYKEIKYNLPSNLSLSSYSSIVINASSAGNTAVKFYDASDKEVFVQYNIKSTSAANTTITLDSSKKANTIKTIGIMSQDTNNYSATVNSITFK